MVVAPLSGRAVLPRAGLSELTVPGIHDALGFWAMLLSRDHGTECCKSEQ